MPPKPQTGPSDDLISHWELHDGLKEIVEKKGHGARDLVTEIVLDFPNASVRANAVPLLAEVFDSPPRELIEQLLSEEDHPYAGNPVKQSVEKLLKDAGWE